ncbi:hypothetical protein EDB19DRAFT_983821 [Suillus lakei]|nr:hypothetical protein EDB19DRAFT_983821 [Suillus lakei]
MADVARGPISHIPYQILQCELGAQTSFDDENKYYIINGARGPSHLLELLHVFIDKFVLYHSCKNPLSHTQEQTS